MITLKSKREIEDMKKSGAIIAGMHKELKKIIKPGLSTWEIEKMGKKYIEDHGGIPAQIGFEGFKYATTVSVNNEVAHAFPRKKLILKDGDIVTVYTVVNLNGAYSDSAWTYAVGNISDENKKLMKVAFDALYIGISKAVVGNRLGDIGEAMNTYIEKENHFGNVREYVGHGIGPTMHEEPSVPHYGIANHGIRLKAGMTITIEPMVNVGSWETKTSQKDGWTVTTKDGSWSAQYEHTIAITDEGPIILTSQDTTFDNKYL